MDFVRYADIATDLLNADLETFEDLEGWLGRRAWLRRRLADRDLTALLRLRRELRPVFEASDRGDEQDVVRRLNELLMKYPVRPYIAGRDAESWHLHVAQRDSSVSALVTAECLMGLATLVVEHGATRLGVCGDDKCERVFLDTSPNRSRRYCSDRCSSRANVAAYRARRRAALT